MENLIGQTVIVSDKKENKKVLIIDEYYDNDVRFYNALDIGKDISFAVMADRYDELFLKAKDKILPKGTKDIIYNPSNINYKKKA